MALDGVPYAIDQSAQHSATSARILAFTAFNGTDGCVGRYDLQVLQQTIPNGTVKIDPGVGVAVNRALNQTYQSYVLRNTASTNIMIAPNNTGSPRSDLVIVRIENPYLGGEPYSVPADPVNGPYVSFRVIQNVPSTTMTLHQVDPTMTGFALARITIPAMTSSITQAMIFSLRWFSEALSFTMISNQKCNNGQTLLGTETTYKHFPNQHAPGLIVPDWAKVLRVQAWFDPQVQVGNILVDWRMSVNSGAYVTASTDFDVNFSSGGGAERAMKVFAEEIPIDPSWNNTYITCKFEARANTSYGALPGYLRCGGPGTTGGGGNGTSLIANYTFGP